MPGLFHLARRFWPHIRQERGLAGASLAAMIADVGLRLLEPWPLKFVMDQLLSGGSPSAAITVAGRGVGDPGMMLALAALGLVGITSLRALAGYLSTVGLALLGNRVLSEVRAQLYDHLQRLSISFHARARGGDLTLRVISDVGLLKEVLVTALLPMVSNVLVLIGMVGVMLWLDPRLTLVALACFPLFWLRTTRMSRRIQDVSREQRRRDGAMAATAAESMGAIRIVQALSLEGVFAKAFAIQNKKSLRDGAKTKRLEAGLERSVDVLVAISTALVLWFGGQAALHGGLTPGELLVFLAYLKSGFRPVRDFAKYTGRVAKASAAGERILELLDKQPEIHDMPGARNAPALRGEIRFEGVSFAYPDRTAVLREVDLHIAAGQTIALVGRSGIGKSTLAGLLLRLYDPERGRILVDGVDLKAFTLVSLRSQISSVLQEPFLFAATIRDNIAYGAPGASDREIEAAARLANAHDFISALPEGYSTMLGERGATLSSGQRQRIAIARAAVRNAPILILDEPTTGLDEISERAVTDALQTLAIGRTTLLITHDLRLAARADLILYLDGGRIVETGSHAALMSVPGLYQKLYRLQSDPEDAARWAEERQRALPV